MNKKFCGKKYYNRIICSILALLMTFVFANHSLCFDANANAGDYGKFTYPEISREILAAKTQKKILDGHKYLFVNEEKIDKLKKYAFGKNKYLTDIYSQLKAKADSYIAKEPAPINVIDQNISYIGRGMEAWDIVSSCALVHLVEGTPGVSNEYADRAWEEAAYLCSLPHWGNYQYIDNNQTAFAVALCYDWLYDCLEDWQKDSLVNALKTKHLDKVYMYFNNPSSYSGDIITAYTGHANHAIMNNTLTFMQALAIADTDLDYSSYIMDKCFKGLELPISGFFPDGAWFEGVGYWSYAANFTIMWIMSMKTAFGTAFGLEDTECILKMADFPIYASSSDYAFIFNDIPYEEPRNTDGIKYNIGILKGDHALQKYSLENDRLDSAFVCLDFDTGIDYDSIDSSMPVLDKYFRNMDLATMRSTWKGGQEIFGGMLVQETQSHRGHMNSGTIAFEALGHQWVTNPGSDNYSLPGYFGGEQNSDRWKYYFGRAEANSCLVINPSLDGEQNVVSKDKIDKFSSAPGGAYAISDLTDTYKDYALSYKRGIMLSDMRTKFILQDELELKDYQEVYSFINLNKCDVCISDDLKYAELSNGKRKVRINIICDEAYDLEIRDCTPLPTSPQMEGNMKIEHIKRLAIHFPDTKGFNLKLEFIPYLTTGELSESEPVIIPMDKWTIDTAEPSLPVLTGITADGIPLEGFIPERHYYITDTLPQTIECSYDETRYDITYETSPDKCAMYIILRDKVYGSCTSYCIAYDNSHIIPDMTDSSGLPSNPWIIDESGIRQTNEFSIYNAALAVFKLPLPEADADKIVDEYLFRFSAWSGSDESAPYPDAMKLIRLPDDFDISAVRDCRDDNVKEILAVADDNKANIRSITYSQNPRWSPSNYYYADITDYANECIQNGLEYMYLGVSCRWTCKLYGNVESSIYVTRDLAPKYSISLKNKAPLSVNSDIAFIPAEYKDSILDYRYQASQLQKDKSYVAVIKPDSNLPAQTDALICAAAYTADNEMIACTTLETVLNPDKSEYQTGAIAVSADTACIKAFIFDSGSLTPLTGACILE